MVKSLRNNGGGIATGLRGAIGPRGEMGPSTIRVGNVATLPETSNASVVNSGTDIDLILEFGVPRGYAGNLAQLVTGAASTITTSNVPPNRTLVSNNDGKVTHSNVTSTELAFIGGVTSSIQTQFETKANIDSPTLSGTVTTSNVNISGALVGNSITANSIESQSVTTSNIDVMENVNAGSLVSNGNIISTHGFYKGDGSFLSNIKSTSLNPIYNSVRTDVATGMVVDGDLFQYNGSIYGSGAGLTGFSEKTNTSLEARLSSYANSTRRLYVSTRGSDENHGTSLDQALRTIKKAASLSITQTVILVEAGTYVEDNPIYVPPNVSIVGDSLRNTVLLAANPRLDYFHVTNMNYIAQVRFVDLRSPGFCAAFPCSLAAVNIRAGRVVPQETGETVRVPVLYSPEAPTGYYIENLPPGIDAFPLDVKNVLEALTQGMADIIVRGTNVGEFGQIAKNNVGRYRRASVYLEAHIPFLQAETMAWVALNVPQLTTLQMTLCKRDVAYIVKALATDLTQGGYVASLDSALKYYKGAVSVLSNGTKDKTAESIVRLGILAGYIATGTIVPSNLRLALDTTQTFFAFEGTETAVSIDQGIDFAVDRMRALFDIVELIIRSPSIGSALEQIDSGGSMESIGTLARSTRQSVGTNRAATRLRDSKDALRASILAWLEQQQNDINGIQLSDTNKVKCARDVGYIVEGIVFDLMNGSFEKTLEYASVYFNATTGVSVLPTDQVTKTADAILYLRDQAAIFIYNTVRPSNVFDKNIETSYTSLLKYVNLGGSRDASGVTISVQLPGPTMYIGYKLRRTNLKKWRLEARETLAAEWTTIGNEDIPQPESIVEDTDDLNEAIVYVQSLCEGIATIILSPEGKFPLTASGNAGGYTRASSRLSANKAFVQAEIIAWVATQDIFASLSNETKALCERDVGFIVEALVGDLRIGGFGKSLEAAMAYYNGTISKLTTPNSREPTAESIRRIGLLAESIITNTPLSNDVRLQAQILQVYDEGAESAITYGTQALVGYSFYRIVMLQTHDSSFFKLGSIEFLEMQLPTILVDGPNDTIGLNTVIRGFDIVDAGEGYVDGTVPVNITPTVPPNGGMYPDQEDAEADAIIVDGKVTSINMRKRFYGSVQSLAIVSGGAGYVVAPIVTISGNAKAKAWIDSLGSVVRLELVDGGSGYSGIAPTVTCSAPPPGGQIATATASIQGSTEPGYEWSLLRGRDYQGGATVSIPGGSREATVRAIMTDDFAEMRAPIYEVGTQGASRNVDERGRLKSLQLMHPGSGYSQTLGLSPTISIPPPESIQPIIVGSPYLQNASNLSGPWDTTGEKVPVTWRLPWNPRNIYNSSLDTETYDPTKTSDERKGVRILDNNGAGGGARIDGRCCAALSPLRSFVIDAFTQLCQGGIGFLLINLA
jgi:hypothetical protein